MDASEFFKHFYIKQKNGGLAGRKSKNKVVLFFMKIILGEGSSHLLYTPDTYDAWLDGTNHISANTWDEISQNWNEDKFFNDVRNALDVNEINNVAARFGIELKAGENADRDLLASAITKQFHEIALGKGYAADIVAKEYGPTSSSYDDYSDKALLLYSKIEIPFVDAYEEALLQDIYVANDLTNSAKQLRRTVRTRVVTISDPTLEKIKAYHSRTVLVGNGGMGKSIMLRHLFVQALSDMKKTGKIPLLAEIRNLAYSNKTILDYLVESVTKFDESFSKEKLASLLKEGRCQILLDGIDEIDLSDKDSYISQMKDLIVKYPNNQFVLASRDCEMADAVNGFAKLYLRPFDDDKKNQLIDRLLSADKHPEENIEIKSFIKGNFITKHSVFSTNPMLLTFVVVNHPLTRSFNKIHLIYQAIYKAIISGHDRAKTGYSRVFYSVKDSDEFTKIFREFCSMTFADRENNLDEIKIKKYLTQIAKKAKDEEMVVNPHAITFNNFVRDACATSCMMYEESMKYYYIDEGFQEYFFAEKLALSELDEVEIMFQKINKTKSEDYESLAAFEMAYEIDKEKVESCFFLPYLKAIFESKREDRAYQEFLLKGYSNVRYSLMDESVAMRIGKDIKLVTRNYPLNSPTNPIYNLILNHLQLTGDFILDLNKDNVEYPELWKTNVYCEFASKDDCSQIKPFVCSGDCSYFEKTANKELYLFESNKPLILEREYESNLKTVYSDTEKYINLIKALSQENQNVVPCFTKCKEYFKQLKDKYSQY